MEITVCATKFSLKDTALPTVCQKVLIKKLLSLSQCHACFYIKTTPIFETTIVPILILTIYIYIRKLKYSAYMLFYI